MDSIELVMPVGYDGNVMPYCIQVEAAARAASDRTLAVFTEPIEKMGTMSSMTTSLTPQDPGGKRMTFAHFYVTSRLLDFSVSGSAPRG